MDAKEFDSIHETGKRLKEIFARDKVRGMDGLEDYLVRSIEEAARLTMRAPDLGWACGKCKTHNADGVSVCGFCDTPRLSG